MSDIERDSVLPIDALVRRRLAHLELSPRMLVERCGYANASKGLRRLADVRAGDFRQASQLLAALPKALEVPAEEVRAAIEQTTARLSAERETASREAFRPHAIILTERERPTQITIAALCGFDLLRRIELPANVPAPAYPGFVSNEIERRLARHGGAVPTFGKAMGFIINYAPEVATAFDLEGRAVAKLDRAYEMGEMSFELSGRTVPLRFGPD